MIFNSFGYNLQFIQKEPCKDASAHLFTLIYKFYSPVTKYSYILRAEYHTENVFAIKFYAKKDRSSDYKYSQITNKGDIYNILITCLKVVPLILQNYPSASFGFIGARTIDRISNRVEDYHSTQRFKIYKGIVGDKIGSQTFDHILYELVSGYLLINKNDGDSTNKENLITRMFADTYRNLLDV